MLTNMGNSKRLEINSAIQNILADRPYVLPKQSGARKLYMTIHESGMKVALARYQAMKSGSEYDLGESELNTLGYQLLYVDRNAGEAVAIFKLNTIEHPQSSNTFDSLGEAYQVNRERDLAIASYESALKLDPSNGHAAAMLRKLRLSRWLPLSTCIIGAFGVLALLLALVLRKRH